MKNLNDFGVQEMNIEEVKNTQGGFVISATILIACFLAGVTVGGTGAIVYLNNK